MKRAHAAVLTALVASLLTPAAALAGRFTADDRETLLLSRAADGGLPDGPSRNGAFSQDRQRATYAAYESDATNIVGVDVNGATDVFLVARRGPVDLRGGPWRPGAVRLISQAVGGGPANGPSSAPDLGGDQIHPARCVAFVSAASNLVRGDRNGRPDAFLYDLRTRRTRIVSLGSGGRPADGTTYEVAVDGACRRIAFVTDARNMGGRLGPAGTKQVYVRVVDGRGAGRTFLASRSDAGRAGRGDSTGVVFSKLGGAGDCTHRCNARAGEAVAYASTAPNLSRRDGNARSDVYVTSFTDRGIRRTVLVSANRRGRAGNGASDQPAIGDNGAYVVFRTQATDLLAGDSNGVADIARVNALEPGRAVWVSRSQAVGSPADGASARPVITRSGSMAFFESDATNLQSTVRGGFGGNFDRNGTGDVFFWSFVSRNASLQSRDSANEILNNAERNQGDHVPHAPARNPATSYYGNYIVWESSYPLIDLPFAASAFPGLAPREAAERSLAEPALNQVYLRYIGPA
jgi:hypothetical protein